MFFGYFLVMFSRLGWFGLAHTPYVRQPLSYLRSFCGMSTLFTKSTSLGITATEYQFYENGSWQNWQQLEKPLFEEYLSKARFASLKHSRLDKHLSLRVKNLGVKEGVEKMQQSSFFKDFTNHLCYSHHQNSKPDSIAVRYVSRRSGDAHPKIILAFKCKP